MSYEEIIQTKPTSSYTKQDLDEIKAISFDKENFSLKGSFSFRGSKYPSDIDLSDIFTACCDKKNTIREFINKLQEIVSNTLRANHWFLELKAGIDQRYVSNTINFPFFEHLNMNGLISDDEFISIHNIFTEGPTQLEIEQLEEFLRQRATIRWTADEVLSSYKILPGSVSLTLEDAINDSKVINIELVVILNNKFTEMSNFFYLLYYASDGSVHTINTPQESYTDFPDFFAKELKENIAKLYYSELSKNYVKLAKRYFTYGKFFQDKKLVQAVYPLLNSNISLASQLKSEIATIEKLIENASFSSIPITVLRDHLESIKARLANIIEIPQNILEKLNDELLDIIDSHLLTAEIVIHGIKPVKGYLSELTNKYALAYLKKVHLVPPPKNLLP